MRRLLPLLLIAASCVDAHAWGFRGHQIVAQLAQTQLSPKASAEVQRLLALEPGETLASISTWADETRNRSTGPWHYVNFPRGNCTYVAERDCPDGQCIVEAINRQLALLGSEAPDEKRLTALKYVVHLIADVHQPLHAGYADDRGGNRYQVQAFGRGTNLHSLWDSGLIGNMEMDAQALTKKLIASPVASAEFSAAKAAEESCRIAQAPGFYPGRRIDSAYAAKFGPVVEQQLRLAGARLAAALNKELR